MHAHGMAALAVGLVQAVRPEVQAVALAVGVAVALAKASAVA